MRPLSALAAAYDKFRVWGFGGVWSYVRRTWNFRRHGRCLWKLARASACGTPVHGITVIGNLTGRVSLDKTLRDFVRYLQASGIPCQTYDMTSGPAIPREDAAGIVTPLSQFDLRRYSHIIVMYRSPLVPQMVPGCTLARIVFHDSEHGIHEMMPYIRASGDEIIALSDFNYRYFKRAFAGQRVFKITYPLLLPDFSHAMPREALRRKYGIGPKDFVVFFNFDFGSYYRKNVPAAIRAFAQAFRDVPQARLVFKTKGSREGSKTTDEMVALVAALGLGRQFVHISTYLSRAEVDGLTGACDVYLSLHRSEGFGIGMAEAMSQAKPVVATDWSANTEFCTPDTACCIPCKMVPIKPHEYPVEMKEWAEADVDAAAAALRRLYEDPALRTELGAKGKAFIAEHFSLSRFKASTEAFLAAKR